MLQHLKCSPEHVLFFDDNMPNVQAARDLGIRSELINAPQLALNFLNMN